MKIIKNGKDRTYQGECKRCGTIYEYSERDYFELIEEKPSGLAEIKEHLFKAKKHIGKYVDIGGMWLKG